MGNRRGGQALEVAELGERNWRDFSRLLLIGVAMSLLIIVLGGGSAQAHQRVTVPNYKHHKPHKFALPRNRTGLRHPPAWVIKHHLLSKIHFAPARRSTGAGSGAAQPPQGLRGPAKQDRRRYFLGTCAPSCGNGPLINPYTGPIQTNPHIYVIFWGSNWSVNETAKALKEQLEIFYEGLTVNPKRGAGAQWPDWSGILRQYCGSNGCPAANGASLSGTWIDPEHTAPTNVSDASIRTEIGHALTPGSAWHGAESDPNAQFVVIPAPYATFAAGFAREFCGYHGTYNSATYTFLGNVADEAASNPFRPAECQYPGDHSPIEAVTGVASHEYAETVTDPHLASWFGAEPDSRGEYAENGDLCNTGHDQYHTAGVWVQGTWDDHLGGCQLYDANPPVVSPIDPPDGASGLTTTTATLNANVNPNGTETHAYFEYGTSPAYGTTVPSPSGIDAGAGVTSVLVSQSITGLKPATTYHFRSVVYNPWSGYIFGPDQTFTTTGGPPIVTAEPPTYVNTFEPHLNASVNPHELDTHYQFEYGETEAYGTKVPLAPEDVGSGAVSVAVSKTLSGLKKSTTYHFRLTATNELGTVNGADRTFTTLPPCKGAEERCSWAANSTPVPVAPSETSLAGVSCVSSSECWAVGKANGGWDGLVERWTGSEWKIYYGGGGGGELNDVSCVSSTWCVAVGSSYGAAFAKSRTTTAWRPMGIPSPAGGEMVTLKGVSCASASACTAVGSYYGEGRYRPLAERWDGSSWSIQTTPLPEGSTAVEFSGVSCPSSGECIAVGKQGSANFAERWYSGAWSITATPNLSGAVESKLEKLSCGGVGACMAVGRFKESKGAWKPFSERYASSSWSPISVQVPSGAKGDTKLRAVSCIAENSCTAVGEYVSELNFLEIPSEEKTLVDFWNGSTWSIQSSPNLEGKPFSELAGVSCASAVSCVAAGNVRTSAGGQAAAFGERYE